MYFFLKIMKMFIIMFFMIFQSSMGLGKLRCDIPIGITQGHDCPSIKGELPQFAIEICQLNIDKRCNE
jgi:hypothetical protein